MKKSFSQYIKEIFTYKDVLFQLVKQQLILRYRRTIFGYLWTLLNPILMMSVTAVVFSSLFKVDLKSFAIFLFAGMIPWGLFNSTIVQTSASFINNENLIKKIYLPRVLFPMGIAIGLGIDSLLSFVALFILMLIMGAPFSPALIFIPIAYFLLFFFVLGLALIVSIVTVFFRDLQYVLGIAMQALFFLTPIIYKSEELTGKVAWLINLNPLSVYIELFRGPLSRAEFPDILIVQYAILISAITFIIGFIFFIYQENKIVFRL